MRKISFESSYTNLEEAKKDILEFMTKHWIKSKEFLETVVKLELIG